MDVFECIRDRRTVREFKPEPVPEEIVERLLQAARWAPSSSNSQPWHFVVVQDRETIAQLGAIATQGPFLGEAPLAIAVVMSGASRPDLDGGRALQQMELMAWSEGLGTCFVGFREPKQQVQVKELLEIPQDMALITVLPFGYRNDGPKGNGVARKPLSEIAHRGRFGTGYVRG
ncbi:MAG: nitroreductase family protein [SAR202 cluster bacterium]|nr:nitroreductase family protein [SAR202 cluster bacterium]MDP6300918.1 nitroreductase family protein [SAR202 cluster bacterium]MDP7103255.1 nitroreductase family protein [SAR202 cluster bacterium]MDP7224830.1 nitroreductase family protein [SAR202 cluster bacterium]MDP7412699.1 nitroreductase family protein [SAR202 cluster bacterium]